MFIKKIFFTISFFLSSFASFAKNPGKTPFDRIYLKAATEITNNDPQLALHVADSLYSSSTKKIYHLKALMLSANVYQILNDKKSAILYAKRAQNIARKIKD